MKSLKDIPTVSNKRVIVRVDFNLPMHNGKILDDFRIKKALPTILYLQKKGAIVILITHLGEDGSQTLEPVAKKLSTYVSNVKFIKSNLFSNETENMLLSAKKGDVVLLENIRREDGEKKNSPSFGRALSRFGDFYVNEAFPVSHRLHASIVGIPKHLESFAGLQLLEEVKNLSSAFGPGHPFLFIMGGAKFSTKIPLIKRFIKNADNVFVGGALANDFFKAKGYEVGKSLVDAEHSSVISLMKNKNLVLPVDVEAAKGSQIRTVKPSDVAVDEAITDIGPESVKVLKSLIEKSKFILWNGPLGKYETGSGGATEKILKLIAQSKAHNVIGGGDTVALVSKLKLEDKLGFVSTGGGATLDFLSTGTLPGIKALK
ncbi:MAG: phosphoglycerate kinase [Patescibacteria group bacterium]